MNLIGGNTQKLKTHEKKSFNKNHVSEWACPLAESWDQLS